MRFLKPIYGITLLCWSIGTAWAAPAFITGTEDIPLLDGLTLLSGDEDVSFDTPAGQILIVEAVGESLTPQTIQSFYQNALPALGWQPTKQSGIYERESETLTISIESEKPTRVRFELSPRDF